MAKKYAEILLLVVIALRSTALLFSKIALADMGPLTLLGLRFLLAFAVLFVIFFKKIVRINRATLLRGLLLGSLFYATMAFELIGLDHTSSSTTAFLENTAIMFVPLFDAALRRGWPRPSSFISGLMALAGVAFLTLHNGRLSMGVGEGCCMLAALFYAATIVATDRLAKKDDAMVLGVLQVGVIGLFGAVSAFIFEQPTLAGAVTWGAAAAEGVAEVPLSPVAGDIHHSGGQGLPQGRRHLGGSGLPGRGLHRVRLHPAAGGPEIHHFGEGRPLLRHQSSDRRRPGLHLPAGGIHPQQHPGRGAHHRQHRGVRPAGPAGGGTRDPPAGRFRLRRINTSRQNGLLPVEGARFAMLLFPKRQHIDLFLHNYIYIRFGSDLSIT